MARACFVTATDTGVGKTIVTAAIVAGLRARGVAAVARKPLLTGALESAASARPGMDEPLEELPDNVLLAAVSGESPEEVSPRRYEPAVSPHLAAELDGAPIDVEEIVSSLRACAAGAQALVVEGIGGLLVPLGAAWDVRRLASELGWPLVVVARSGLGTLNHTLLTLEAARRSGLEVRGVVLNPWPAQPDVIELSNRATIENRGGVEVTTLALLEPLTRATLAQAAASLPYERWLAE